MKRRRFQSATAPSKDTIRPSPRPEPPASADPIDEADQEKLIQHFRHELKIQHGQISQTFRYLVYAVLVSCAMVTVYIEYSDHDKMIEIAKIGMLEEDFSRVVTLLQGVICAPILHFFALKKGLEINKEICPGPSRMNLKIFLFLILLNILCVMIQLVLAAKKRQFTNLFDRDLENIYGLSILHVILLASNICTMGFAWILCSDKQSIEKTLDELKASKYQFKTL